MQQWALCEETHSWVSLSQTKDSDFVNLGRAQESVLRDSGNETQVTFQNYWLWSSSWLWLLLDFLKKEILFFFSVVLQRFIVLSPTYVGLLWKNTKTQRMRITQKMGVEWGEGSSEREHVPFKSKAVDPIPATKQ